MDTIPDNVATQFNANIAQWLVLWSSKPETTVRICLFAPLIGIEVKRLRCRPVTAHGAGSTPVSPAFLYGVTVTQLFLVQLFMVRIHVGGQ